MDDRLTDRQHQAADLVRWPIGDRRSRGDSKVLARRFPTGALRLDDELVKLAPHERHGAEVKEWGPTALEVFSFIRGQVTWASPGHVGEHIGSTSVPGLPGKASWPSWCWPPTKPTPPA